MTLLIAFTYQSSAQQQVMFTQYMFNGLAINPAYAGSHESASLTLLARKQWVGLDGAPNTQTFSAHAPLNNTNAALGVMFLRDEIGVTKQHGGFISYAYRIPMGNGKLSMGIQGGFNRYSANYSGLNLNDPTFDGGDIVESHFNTGVGLYYYTDRFYAGVSIPQILNTEFDADNPDSEAKLIRHYFATIGYVFDLSPMLKLKPNLLVKNVPGAPTEFDINANLLINERIWLGLSYRSFDSFDAIFSMQITDKIQFGYSYDFATTSQLKSVNSGSHEFMLNYRFSLVKEKIITPRYF